LVEEVIKVTKTEMEIKSELAIQLDKKTNDQSNFAIAANSFLFSPLATLVTGTLEGYYVYIPIVVCAIGIAFNAYIIWYLNNMKSNITAYKLSFDFKGFSIIDAFKKFAPYVFLAAWIFSLILVLLQIFTG
jgi:hypothetical protein